MAVYQVGFVYELDQDGNSTNGHVDALIPNSACDATESVDDSIVSIGESFTVVFSDPLTNAQYGGTYIYRGRVEGYSALVGEDVNGEFFMFTNDGTIPIGANLHSFTADVTPVCFLGGSMIACPGGERAVQTLAHGDLVMTADGRSVPVRWLGRQTIVTMFGPRENRWPVVIDAGALDGRLPLRPLRVTADHALFLDGVLVQAGALVNGSTIRRIAPWDLPNRYVVYHIEIEHHELVLAEGTPAETFIDNVTRRQFDNYAEFEARCGTTTVLSELSFPRAMSARQVPPAISRRVAAEAARRAPMANAG